MTYQENRTYTTTRNLMAGGLHAAARILTALLLLMGVTGAWAQDFSGVYYIGTVGYNKNNTTTNYYLCPTEEWCYYQATDDFTGTDNGMPFITTYQCRDGFYDAKKAVWVVEKHPTEDYYYIKRALDGKYLVSNGTIRTTNNPDRMRVHLEAIAPGDLDDKELFTIAEYGNYLTISPKGVVGGAADRNWLTVNAGNKPSLKGESGKTGGPTGYTNTAGIIGVYTKGDANAKFYLEKATIDPPTITNNYDGTFTITSEAEASIYYTIDGTTPTTSTTDTPTSGTGTTSISGITIDDEIERLKRMVAHCKEINLPIVALLMEQDKRSKIPTNANERCIDLICPNAEWMICIKGGNSDGRFDALKAQYNIPLTVYSKAPMDLMNIFKQMLPK